MERPFCRQKETVKPPLLHELRLKETLLQVVVPAPPSLLLVHHRSPRHPRLLKRPEPYLPPALVHYVPQRPLPRVEQVPGRALVTPLDQRPP